MCKGRVLIAVFIIFVSCFSSVIMDDNLIKNLRKLNDVANFSTEKRADFHRSILVAGASILGILLSLHSTQTSCLYIRLVFLLSILLLLSGVLLSAVVLRDLSSLPEQARKAFAEELQEALLEEMDPQWIGVSVRKRTVLCEKWCMASFLASLFLLVVYTALSLFFP